MTSGYAIVLLIHYQIGETVEKKTLILLYDRESHPSSAFAFGIYSGVVLSAY